MHTLHIKSIKPNETNEPAFFHQRAYVYKSMSLRLQINEPAFLHQRACIKSEQSLTIKRIHDSKMQKKPQQNHHKTKERSIIFSYHSSDYAVNALIIFTIKKIFHNFASDIEYII